MKTFRIIAVLFTLLLSIISVQAQVEKDTSSLLILPFDANGIDPVYVQTAESIFRVEIAKLSNFKIISENKTDEILNGSECYSTDCALQIGKKAGASVVIGCKLAALGEKIIVQYFVVDVPAGKTKLMDQLTAANLEDLEQVIKRMASNIVENKQSPENAMVGNIVEQETTEPLRRTSRKNIGVSFGYLFPQEGYDNGDKKFTINLHLDYELEELAAGMLLGIRDGFAMNVYTDYLFSRTDICPYAGGAFGFHWVAHENAKGGDGFELTFNTGFRILHTYNFQILLNLEYIMTFNNFNDRAIVFTIGIL